MAADGGLLDAGFSGEWDGAYAAGAQHSLWPYSDVVSLVMRYARDARRVLDVGCGTGPHVGFLLDRGLDYYGVEGSRAAVETLLGRFPTLRERVACVDFTREIPFAGPFDLVLDRSAMTHNATPDLRRGLRLVRDLQSPGGLYVGVDWFSTAHPQFVRGEAVDAHTRGGFVDGVFRGLGRVHFSDEAHLRELFAQYEFISLEERLLETYAPRRERRHAGWNFVARRR